MIVLLAPLFLAGCFNSPDDTDKGTDTADDTGGGNGADTNVTVELDATAAQSSQISTVMRVTWTTDAPGTSVVEWGTTRSYGEVTTDDGQLSTEHEVLVAGMPTNTTVYWRARSVVDGEALVSAGGSIETEPQDPTLPRGSLEVNSGATHGFRLIPQINAVNSTISIYNDEGAIVWWHFVDETLTATDAQLSADGTEVLYLTQDHERVDATLGGLVHVPLDAPEDSWQVDLYGCHHAFAQLPDGRIAYLYADGRTYEGELVYGDAVVIAEADGSNPVSIWSTWDYWPVTDISYLQQYNNRFYPDALDWTHGNSLHYDPVDDTLVASMHNVAGVVKMDLDGTVVWEAGGPTPTLTLSGSADTAFEDQHNPYTLPNGNLLMFDNGPFDLADGFSELAEYEIDTTNHTYTRVWNFDWTGDEVTYLMGDVTRLDNGNTFSNWGISGAMVEVDSGGNVVWQYVSELATTYGFSEFNETMGAPVR